MAWGVTADPAKFEEALEWFLRRYPITDEELELLESVARTRAFRVAGVQQLDVVADVWDVLRRAIEQGKGLGWFKSKVREKLENEWGRKDGARIETVYRTNVQTAYNRGRWRQMQHPAVKRLRPYLMYDAVLDSRTSELCRTLDGTVLEAEDPFWETHHPPLHHRCRSGLRTLTRRQAERKGITEDTSELPDAADEFGSNPELDEWEPDPDKYPPELWRTYERKQEDMTE